LAFEDQVHRRFGSTIHFSSSSGAKEFFLVVSFSSASFPLNEESVGLALQCYIGGDRIGFRVYKLLDARFHFLVASNKVGHFVYGLKDRIWPDFVCHFSLFRGVPPSITGFYKASDYIWSSRSENIDLAQRSPTRLNPNLDILRRSSLRDESGASDIELAKFGFVRSGVLDKSIVQVDSNFDSSSAKQVCSESSSSNHSVLFGSFLDPIILDREDHDWDRTFVGTSFAKKMCSSLPTDTLLQLEDLRMAGYSKQQIMDTLRIPFVPPKDVVFEFIGSCSGCDLPGHSLQHFPSSLVNRPGNSGGVISVKCFKCLDLGHMGRDCLMGWRCKRCSKIGHIARDCSVSMRI
jgi:hypothetical protein